MFFSIKVFSTAERLACQLADDLNDLRILASYKMVAHFVGHFQLRNTRRSP